jgi:RNA polymerase sigma-70 factor, ECF subfamily
MSLSMTARDPRPVLVPKDARTGEPATLPDDAALAKAAAKGDPAAHAAIWDRYVGLVRRILVRTIGPGADVEDQLQEVFLRFYRNRALLRDPSALRSFLFGIALRVAASELRARRIRSWLRLTKDGVLDDQQAPSADPDAREAVVRLYGILDRLDPNSRVAFVLHYVDGWELTEVAEVAGVSLATVKRRLARISVRVFASAQADNVLVKYLDDVGVPNDDPAKSVTKLASRPGTERKGQGET